MRIPMLKVRSKDGYAHIVGENPHDLLYIDENDEDDAEENKNEKIR